MKPYFQTDAPEPEEYYLALMVPNPNGTIPVKITVTLRVDFEGQWTIAGIESECPSYQPKFEDLIEHYQDEITEWAEETARDHVRALNFRTARAEGTSVREDW